MGWMGLTDVSTLWAFRPAFSQMFRPIFAGRFDPIQKHSRRSNASNSSTHSQITQVFVDASILYNIARESQGKSVSLYFLMNINDLGAMAVSSRV